MTIKNSSQVFLPFTSFSTKQFLLSWIKKKRGHPTVCVMNFVVFTMCGFKDQHFFVPSYSDYESVFWLRTHMVMTKLGNTQFCVQTKTTALLEPKKMKVFDWFRSFWKCLCESPKYTECTAVETTMCVSSLVMTTQHSTNHCNYANRKNNEPLISSLYQSEKLDFLNKSNWTLI